MGCEGDNKGLPIQKECTGIPTSEDIYHMMGVSDLFDGKYTRSPGFKDMFGIIRETTEKKSSSILETKTT